MCYVRFKNVHCSYINVIDLKYIISQLKSFGLSCCHYSQRWWQQWDSARRRNSVKNKHVLLKRSQRLSACYPTVIPLRRKKIEEEDGHRRRPAASHGCCPPGAWLTPQVHGDAIVLWPKRQGYNRRKIVHRLNLNRRSRRKLGRRLKALWDLLGPPWQGRHLVKFPRGRRHCQRQLECHQERVSGKLRAKVHG